MLKLKITKSLSESEEAASDAADPAEQDIHYNYKKLEEISSMAGGSVAGGISGWADDDFGNNKRSLKEGGNIFKTPEKEPATKRIKRENVDGTLQWLEDLTGLPLVNNKLGTTGKRETSGDLDIAVSYDSSNKDDLTAILLKWLIENKPELGLSELPSAKGKRLKELKKTLRGWIAHSGNSVHFKTPILGDESNGFVQTDFMFGDVDFMKWSTQPEYGDKYNGHHRHVLLNAIAKTKGYAWGGFTGLKRRETKEQISDPDQIVKILFDGKLSKDQMTSIDNLIKYINDEQNVSEEDYEVIHQMVNNVVDLPHRNSTENDLVTEGTLPKGRIHHPEDLMLWQGSEGALTALDLIEKALKEKNSTTLKWDGSPAVIFGRDESGEFIFADKNAFVVKSYDGKVKSPEQMQDVLLNKRHRDKGKEPSESYIQFANKMTEAFSLVEKNFPENFQGYYFGDLLYFNRPELLDGHYKFKPNVVEYTVKADSDLGRDISKSELAIAVHGMIELGGEKKPLTDFSNTLLGDVLLLSPVHSDTDINFDVRKLSKVQAKINSCKDSLDFMAGDFSAARLSDLPNIFYRYINFQTANDFNNLASNFLPWIDSQSKFTNSKKESIKSLVEDHKSKVNDLFECYMALMEVKNDIVASLDTKNDQIRASIGDIPIGEGYVISLGGTTIKLVDRSKFTRANRSVIRESKERELSSILFIPGGFKPPHKGHIELIKQAIKKAGPLDQVYIVSGKDTRGTVTAEQAEKVFEIMLEEEGLLGLVELVYFDKVATGKTYSDTPANIKKGIAGQPILSNSPMVKVGLIAAEVAKDNADILVAASKADPKHTKVADRVINYHASEVDKRFNVEAVVVDPLAASEDAKVSATDMRAAIQSGNYEEFTKFVPDSVDPENVQKIFSILTGKEPNYNMKSKNEIVEKYKRGKLLEERVLRKYIRGKILESKLLKELADNELTSSTGTNIAAKTLEKFIKGLPTQYKTLASSKEQRLSYAAHYIQAIKNSMISVLAKKGLDLSTTDEPVGLAVGGEPSGEKFTVSKAPDQTEEPPPAEDELMSEQEDDELGDLNLDLDADEQEGEIDPEGEVMPVTPDEKAKVKKEKAAQKVLDPEQEEMMPQISGLDDTGRELASEDVKVAIAAVKDGVNMLTDATDVKDFISTLITQIKIRFNLAEREITGTDATNINSTPISSAEKFMNQLEESKSPNSSLSIDDFLIKSLKEMMKNVSKR